MYANDNPIANIDPAGAYTCNSEENPAFCKKIDRYVDNLRKAESYYQQMPTSRAQHNNYLLVKSIVDRVGSKGDGKGPTFSPANFKDKSVARLKHVGEIDVDTDSVNGRGMGASTIGHEVQHALDDIAFKKTHNRYVGTTNDKATAKKSYTWTETNAYHTQSVILGAFGSQLSAPAMNHGIKSSVNQDMQRWIRSHAQP